MTGMSTERLQPPVVQEPSARMVTRPLCSGNNTKRMQATVCPRNLANSIPATYNWTRYLGPTLCYECKFRGIRVKVNERIL